eukprot:4722109-Prymnesium_polylepis.1
MRAHQTVASPSRQADAIADAHGAAQPARVRKAVLAGLVDEGRVQVELACRHALVVHLTRDAFDRKGAAVDGESRADGKSVRVLDAHTKEVAVVAVRRVVR